MQGVPILRIFMTEELLHILQRTFSLLDECDDDFGKNIDLTILDRLEDHRPFFKLLLVLSGDLDVKNGFFLSI